MGLSNIGFVHHIQESEPRRLPQKRSETFLVPTRKVSPGNLHSTVLKHFWPQPGKWTQETSRGQFSSISSPNPESRPRRLPEDSFKSFLRPAWKVSPGNFKWGSNGVAKVVLWCQPNDTFVKIIDVAIIFETQISVIGLHQSTVYENSNKMKASEVMFWCKPNDKFMKNDNSWKS